MSEMPPGLKAIAELANSVMGRHSTKHGFEGFGVFLDNKILEERLPQHCNLSSMPDAFATDVVQSAKDNSDELHFMFLALEFAMNGDDVHARDLTQRIWAFMHASEKLDRFRKPMYFVSANEEGIAIFIAVTSEFWNS